MEEKNITAIAVKATAYKENDKLIRLLCSDGKIETAVMKGVKKPKAKLRYGAQPFAFCEYTLVSRGGFNTVTGCVIIEDLFVITQDIDKFSYGSLILEAADAAATESFSSEIFLFLLRALKDILYSKVPEREVAAGFFLEVLKFSGVIDETQKYTLNQLIHRFESEYGIRLKSAAYIINLSKFI